MGYSLLIDFTGLPSDLTLRSLAGDDIRRMDPLEYVGRDNPLEDSFFTDGADGCVMAYCSGAAVAIDVATALQRRSDAVPHVVLIDPTPVDEGYATSALGEILAEHGSGEAVVDQEALVQCVRASPADAERNFIELVKPPLHARLERLGLEGDAVASSAEELAQRFGRWARYLAWALAGHSSLTYDGPVSVLRVDPGRRFVEIAGSGTRYVKALEYTPGAYLSSEIVLKETRRVISATSETVGFSSRVHRE